MKKILAVIISAAICTSALSIMNVKAYEEEIDFPYGTGCIMETPEEFAENTGTDVISDENVEENINIYEKYTMEEFIALSEEEVCSISEEISEKYKQYKEFNENKFRDYLDPDIIEWPVDMTEEDIQVAFVDLYITEELMTEIYDYYKEHGEIELKEVYLSKLFSVSPDWCMRKIKTFIYPMNGDGPYSIQILTKVQEKDMSPDDMYSMSAKLAIWYTSISGALDFEFEYNSFGAGQRVNFGDINTDNKISICDIIMLSKYNTGGVTLNDYQKRCADCNNDGEVNDLDTYALMSYLVNLTDKLPYKS